MLDQGLKYCCCRSRNHPLRLGLLASGGRQWIGGVIYTHNLIRAMSSLPHNERPILGLLAGPDFRIANYGEDKRDMPPVRSFAYHRNMRSVGRVRAVARSLRRFKWPFSLERAVVTSQADAVFSSQVSLGRNFPTKWIGWIPDFQHKRLTQFFSEDERRIRDESYQKIVDESSQIVVSSQDAYRDLMRWFPTDPKRVSVMPFAAASSPRWYQGDPAETAAELALPERYLIFPSQFWAHKNHRVVFDAIGMVRDKGISDISLVCTGYTHDYRWPYHFTKLETRLRRLALTSNVHITGLLPRLTQIQLMRRAAAVIQPSLFEGWSSLVEDTQALGKRIYLSDIAIHREQDPPNAVFFRPDSAEQLAELLARDWQNLRAGPDIEHEAKARQKQERRVIDFGRLCVKIAGEVVRGEKGK